MSSDKKALASITENLQAGEQILDSIHATYIVSRDNSNNPIGALVLTNKRVIFQGSIGLKREQHSSLLKLVTSADLVKGGMLSHLQLTLAGSVAKYRVKYNDAEGFLKSALTAISAEQTDSVPTSSTPSATDELMKLADLHSKGLLSDEEFTAAKAKALS